MASVKIIHYTQKVYSNGTSPIILQIIQGKSVKRKVIFSVFEWQWNDKDKRVIPKKHSNYASINMDISNEYNRIEKLLIENPYAENILDKPTEAEADLNFRQIADLYLQPLIAKSGWTYITFSGIINKFLGCVGDNIKLRDIDERVMQKWVSFMQGKGNKEKTINNNIKVIRFVSEFAARNKYDTKPEALHNYKSSAGTKSFKVKLTAYELEAFKDVVLPIGSKLSEIRDMFLFAVYLRGVRISDIIMLKQSYIRDGRIIYRSEKTDKGFDIKLIPEAVEIVDKYKDEREYLFSFFNYRPSLLRTATENELEKVKQVKNITANINGKLRRIAEKAKINKKISTHIARHTFARMALDKIKDSNITMDLLGHTSMKVHEAYIREISQSDELDDAADRIFG